MVQGPIHLQEADEVLEQEICAALRTSALAQYACGLLYAHLKSQGISVTRDRMFKILKKVELKGVEARCKGQVIHKRRLKTSDPNWTWFLDGHLKFRLFGIDVYAGIIVISRLAGVDRRWNYARFCRCIHSVVYFPPSINLLEKRHG